MLKENNGHRSDPAAAPATASGEEYKVGPGRPPREYQFKPGQSGNPKGAKRKPPSLAPDEPAILVDAFSKPVKLKQGGKERTVTMFTAMIEQLVAQAVKGDHRARRDLFLRADKYGLDLMKDGKKALDEALASNHAAILLSYVQRQYDKVVTPPPVFAPTELLDDDQEEGK